MFLVFLVSLITKFTIYGYAKKEGKRDEYTISQKTILN